MTLAMRAGNGLEYYPCRYSGSRVLFRGPRRSLEADYVAFLGGSETYGLFIPEPVSTLVEKALGQACVNFGNVNAGLDLYLNDPEVLRAASGARAVVLQVMGAQAISNRYYAVHPRRNDRFLKANTRLLALYPEVDFTEFSFVRHMLGALHDTCPDRFTRVVEELQAAWIARMTHLLSVIKGQVVLLWFSDQPPPENAGALSGRGPLFVNRAMIKAISPRTTCNVEVAASAQALGRGTRGMIFGEMETTAAEAQLGPLAHEEAASALVPVLRGLV